MNLFEFLTNNIRRSSTKCYGDLIEGKDNYPPQDFNKNNLIKDIPKPSIIYKKDYTIYGAGKLIRK